MTAPICTGTQHVEETQATAPAGNAVVEKIHKHYAEIADRAGVLTSAQEAELTLQRDFISSVANLAASVPVLGNYNRFDSALASLLGLKRYLWQSAAEGTVAGVARQTLRDRSQSAAGMIRMIAMEKSLPNIRALKSRLLKQSGGVPASRVLELLHDQIVVGNYPKLLNVVDSPIVRQQLQERAIKHIDNMVDAGLPEQAIDTIQELAEAVSRTFDETRAAAAKAGFDIEGINNGGYFPLRATEEFGNYLRQNKETWLKNYKSVEEIVQVQRRTNLPVVADLNHMAALLQKQLLGGENAGALWSSPEALREAANKAQEFVEKTAEVETLFSDKLAKALGVEEAKLVRAETKAESAATKLITARHKATLAKAEAKYRAEGFKGAELKSLMQVEKEALATKKAELLDTIANSWEKKKQIKAALVARETNEAKEAALHKVWKSRDKQTQAIINHDAAKLRLLEIMEEPGAISEFLSKNFSENKLKRLFDAGYLQQLPALSDELNAFYRNLDLGVRGLSDAIVLDPVAAIKNYAEELGKAAQEQMLFKTAFDMGADAGWVKSAIAAEDYKNYIRVGSSGKLQKWLGSGELSEEASNLYIHRAAADQLTALLELNTNVTNLQTASTAWGMFTSFTRKTLIGMGGFAYVQRVFTQNLIAHYAATGGIDQLPFALTDSFRMLLGGWDKLNSVDKVFNVGGTKYSVAELFKEVQVRRGGEASISSLDGAPDKADLFEAFSKQRFDRFKHFNELYENKFGVPLVGKAAATVATGAKVAGNVLKTYYTSLATANGFLDNAFRWSAVRHLASEPRAAKMSLEELMVELDTYFSINADAGSLGTGLGSVAMPFAQFAINAPGAALRHALNHPWRTANVMQLYAGAGAADTISESELPPWLRQSQDYFYTTYVAPDGKRGVIMPQNVDFMLDSYTWLQGLARDLTGLKTPTATEYIENKSDPGAKFNRAAADLMGKTYIGQAALAAMGVDPRSLEKYEASASGDTLLGVSTTRAVRAALINLMPVLGKLDKSLPASLVGQAPTTSTGFGGIRTTNTDGTPSLFGATPVAGGAARAKNEQAPAWVRNFSTLTGVGITEIDPQKNVISTYTDFDSRLREIRKNRMSLFRKLKQTNASESSPEYKRYEELKALEVVVAANKLRIDNMALRLGYTPPSFYQKLNSAVNRMYVDPLEKEDTLLLLQQLQETP